MLTCSKVNLSLAVTAVRPNGFHELDSVFYPFSAPSDEITIEDAPDGIAIRCDAPGVPLDPRKNLCGKAAIAYFRAAKLPMPGVVIHLKKNIPVAAGMGGGSADGATVLRLLQEKYGALSNGKMESVAFSLGADVPFFLNPLPSHVTGAGEHHVPIEGLPENQRIPLLLAAPQFPVSAAWAYDHMDLDWAVSHPPCTKGLIRALRRSDYEAAATMMRNDLEEALYDKFPLLVLLREFLLDQGALKAMISGSGPTMLALFADEAAAQAVCAEGKASFDPSVRWILPR